MKEPCRQCLIFLWFLAFSFTICALLISPIRTEFVFWLIQERFQVWNSAVLPRVLNEVMVSWCALYLSGKASNLRCELCGSHFGIKSAVLWDVTPCIFIAGIKFWRSLLDFICSETWYLPTNLHGLLYPNIIILKNCVVSKNRYDMKQVTMSANSCACL